MREGLKTGTVAADDSSRSLNRMLGEILKALKLTAQYQRMRHANQIEELHYFASEDLLTVGDMTLLKEAARIHQDNTQKLSKKTAG